MDKELTLFPSNRNTNEKPEFDTEDQFWFQHRVDLGLGLTILTMLKTLEDLLIHRTESSRRLPDTQGTAPKYSPNTFFTYLANSFT